MPEAAPRVSVIMPLYNRADLVGESIASLQRQTLRDWELVVVDDGSTDGSAEVVERLASEDGRIRLIRQENSGQCAAPRNRAIADATGDLVSFLDSDDLLHPDKLSVQADLMDRHPDVDMIFSNMKIFFGDDPHEGRDYLGRVDWHARTAHLRTPVEEDVYLCEPGFYRFMSTEVTSITVQTVMVRRSALDRLDGPFDEEMILAEDIDLWFRLARDNRILYVDRPLAYYRRHDTSIMGDGEKVHRGFIMGHSRNLERAEGVLDDEAVETIRDRVARATFNLGYHYVTQGRYAEGRRCYREAMGRVPGRKILEAWLKSWVRQLLRRGGPAGA